MTTPILAVIDNDAWALRTIMQWLKTQPQMCTVAWGTTSCAQAVHDCLYAQPSVDVLLVDMALGSMSGPGLCKLIRRQSARPAMLGMTALDPENYREDLAMAGAQGIMNKKVVMHGLPLWIPTLVQGGSMEPGVFPDAASAHQALCGRLSIVSGDALSAREREVLSLYAKGKSTKEVAGIMNITRNTVYAFVKRAAAKLGVHNRGEAIEKARWYGML
ncbi:helix-turn-helix transcriptional regulator [Bifidobacterium pseudolongum]|nr:response regulator transcription factor [Bifidobacterium pseudolongum]